MLRKLLVFAVVFVLASGMLVACGGEENEEEGSSGQKSGKSAAKKVEKTEPTPVETVQLSYESTVEETTARVAFDMKMSGLQTGSTDGDANGGTNGAQAPAEFAVSSNGVVDFADQRSRTTMKMGTLGSLEVRQLGNTVYQKMPPEMSSELPGTKPWIEMDLDAFYREQYGAGLSEMQGSAPTDPTRQLEYLEDVGQVKEIGREEVRGVGTTHYRAVVDLDKEAALNEGPDGDPDVRKAYEKMEAQIGASELPMDVWLDGKDRIRRYEIEMPLEIDVPADPSAPEGGPTVKLRARISMSEEVFDFGVPVNVSPPPPEQTMGYEEFQRQLQQQMQQPPAQDQQT